ncbi:MULTISPECIES: hypothetical protein [Variovorax]|jgi:hypothetical protein|uniref:hypothetical protein n=1 Tax=Variovorax TaxID=34072 RepID=UPI0008695275|nr:MULTISPECIES: hypothetical protein [Variovorax]ODU16080.1 MAG: hypothetical protein ABS94_16360 [Variovorax sp. SCN 67-85]ODV22330.1 MAG: hypothetical protein ABT25_21540 [Variovorax sp. SCN 67-20]OJZ14280.1 MAG: hypothetical protein BGP22_06205 [Variovorax sp. 67-131]UKI08819.1 hypothetical protein L3V85_02885 [Variovorax paradoxus]
MSNPESFFDCLHTIAKLQRSLQGLSQLDIQRIGYLSCILALYDKKPVADWGYQFANTDLGKPFSYELSNAMKTLHASGRLLEEDGRFQLSDDGQAMLRALDNLEASRARKRYLDAACFSMLAVPRSTLSQGLDREPTVASSQLRSNGAMLLDGPAITLLYDQLAGLATIAGPESTDLVSPSVLWLSYSADAAVSHAVSNQEGMHA